MGTVADKIARLEAELAKLKAAQPAPPIDPAAVAAHRDAMHQAAERRMGAASAFTRDQLAEMERACPTNVVRDIALRDARAPQGPSSAGASGQVTRVSHSPGLPGTTGWQAERPFVRRDLPPGVPPQHPTPGVRAADALMDQADAADRLELAKRIAAQKATIKGAA